MRVKNPEVTLDWEAHGLPSDAREAAFLDWLCSVVAYGDDGRTYWFGISPLALKFENTDLWHFEISWEAGEVVDLPGSVFKVAKFPPVGLAARHTFPGGSLKVCRTVDHVSISLGSLQIICRSDRSWHVVFEDKERGIRAEFSHVGAGYPTWYGRERPSALTPHSIAYGYNWSGTVEGVLTLLGREIRIKGKGIRERYIAVDSSAAEIGGWEDWMWFHFDEAFGSLYEMKLGRKDMSLNLVNGGHYLPEGRFTIQHHDWAYFPALGGFVPSRYQVRIETDVGTLDMSARAVGATVWGVTGQAPSMPVATLNWDRLTGSFTAKDGQRMTLTNGLGGVSIRQWKPYPDFLGVSLGHLEAVSRTCPLTTL